MRGRAGITLYGASLRGLITVCCGLLPSACGLIADYADPNTINIHGVQPTLEQLKVGSTLDAQNSLVNTLLATAGIKQELYVVDENWRLVWKAGQYEIGPSMRPVFGRPVPLQPEAT